MKYTEAVRQEESAKKSLVDLETDVEESFPGCLSQWRASEEEWKSKVVDMKEHRNLPNPYEPDSEKGMLRNSVVKKFMQPLGIPRYN